MARWWIGFVPYVAISIVHVGALAAGVDALAAPTKLALMPLLALGAAWAIRGTEWTAAHTLLFVAVAISWLGDSAGAFFPWAPTVPTMLLWFGLAHLAYIWLFWRMLAIRAVPPWSIVYAFWWGALVAVLVPVILGQPGGAPFAVAVAVYGLLLGGTAVAASRCHAMIAWGGAFFLVSDSILAFRLFVPDAMPDWTSPLVMLTYTLGQGLIVAGIVLFLRRRTRRNSPLEVAG